MRISLFFLFLTVFSVSANTHLLSQQINLNVKDATLTEVLSALKEQTGHMINYNYDRLAQEKSRITVELKNVALSEALDELLKELPYAYMIIDQMVMIIPAPNKMENPQSSFPAITGKVVDSDGQPLIGVTVIIKGTSKGAASDAEGRFRIENPGKKTVTLLTSYIGKQTREITVEAGADITIRLEDTEQRIEDVVVTGYQTIARDRATGSFGSVSRDELSKPTSDISTRLVGTVSGVQATSDAEGNISFEIRGMSSFSNAEPLVVVDGFPITGNLSTLNPNDIQSITILKDAAAASIWGAQAANGVITVVTRRAAAGGAPTKVELNMFYSISPKIDLDYAHPLATSAQTIEYEKRYFNAWDHSPLYDSFYSIQSGGISPAETAMTENYHGYLSDTEMNKLLEYYKTLNNKKQIKQHLFQNASKQQVNISISGGNERTSNYLSLLYQRQVFSEKEKDNWKGMIDYRTNVKLTRWLDFALDASFTYMKETNNSVPYTNISPYEMLIDEDGNYTDIGQIIYAPALYRYIPAEDLALFPYDDWTYNPITEMKHQDKTNTHINGRIQGALTFKIIDGLSFTTSGQYQLNNSYQRNFYGEETHHVRISNPVDIMDLWYGGGVNSFSDYDPVNHTVTPNLPKGGFLDQTRERQDQWMLRQQIDFSRDFGEDHSVNALVGTEIKEQEWEQITSPRTYGYNEETLSSGTYPNGPSSSKNILYDMLGASPFLNRSYVNTFDYTNRRFFNLYGNASYTYKNRYTVSGSVRTDASNLITDDPDYRYAPFWSVGGSWAISRENFMQSVDWVNNLTFRITYGYNGNVDASTAPQPLLSLASTPNDFTGGKTATIRSYGNPTLRWERTGQINAGVWYSLFDDKLSGKLEFYNKNGKDLIARIAIPSVNGTTSQKLNNATMRNTGFEFEVGTRQNFYADKIRWTGSLNVSYNKNKVTDLFEVKYDASSLAYGNTYVEGCDANTLWAFQYNGMVNVAPDGAEASWQPSIKGAKEGEYFLLSSWTTGNGLEFMKNAGTTKAPWILGMTNTFNIYDFDFSFTMTAKLGHVFSRNGFNYPTMGFGARPLPNKHISDLMYEDGSLHDGSKYVPLPQTDEQFDYYFWDRFYPYMDYLVENAGHIRMQEISLAYNMPNRILKKLGPDALRIYGQVNNVFNIYFNKYNQDPEYPEGTIKPTAMFTFGLKLTF